MYVRLLRTRSHRGRKIWVIWSSHTDPWKLPSTLLILGPLDVHVASFPCPHNIYTHPGFSTLCTSSAYFLPLFFLQGVLPFPQLALSTRRRGWMGTGNARFLALPLSVSPLACVCVGGCVCDIHLQNQHTFTQPPSHADLHIESVLLIFEWPKDHHALLGGPPELVHYPQQMCTIWQLNFRVRAFLSLITLFFVEMVRLWASKLFVWFLSI